MKRWNTNMKISQLYKGTNKYSNHEGCVSKLQSLKEKNGIAFLLKHNLTSIEKNKNTFPMIKRRQNKIFMISYILLCKSCL